MRTSLLPLCLAVGALLASPAVAGGIELLTSAPSGAIAYALGNATYYSPAKPALTGCVSIEGGSSSLLPLTVLKTNETTITPVILEDLTAEYARDDVWTPGFLEGALVLAMPSGAVLGDGVVPWIVNTGVKYLLLSVDSEPMGLGSSGINVLLMPSVGSLRPGPYTLSISPSQIAIHEAYLLQRDKLEAFLFGVTPSPGSSAYAPVDLMLPSYQDAWIPIPSNLYWLGDERPMAGLRVALKDIYDLEGVQTGGGSRSYAEVYDVSNATAASVEKLLEMGAVIIVSNATTILCILTSSSSRAVG